MTDDEDNYERTGRAASPASLVGAVGNFEPPTLGYSPEWWEKRDREVAQERAKDAAALEISRMTTRAGELRENGFPDMAVSAALAELDDTAAMQRARLFVQMAMHGLRKRLLILAGGVGVGKTTAATWVTMKGQDPRPGFIRISELERRGRYDKDLGEWLGEKTSLVIDDVGAEYLDGKGAFRSLLDEIIDTFYSNRRTLVMTTNLRPRRGKDEDGKDKDEPEQFYERYGDRVWSRLSQLGEWGDCGTRDLRREQRP